MIVCYQIWPSDLLSHCLEPRSGRRSNEGSQCILTEKIGGLLADGECHDRWDY